MRFRALSVLALCGCVALSGCGSGKNEHTVTGKVTVDGQPVPQGSITFFPADGKSPVGGGSIKDGSYTAFVPPGEKIVTIYGTKVSGTQPSLTGVPDSPPMDVVEDFTHAGYGVEQTSGLTASITSETKDLNFELSKDGPKKP